MVDASVELYFPLNLVNFTKWFVQKRMFSPRTWKHKFECTAYFVYLTSLQPFTNYWYYKNQIESFWFVFNIAVLEASLENVLKVWGGDSTDMLSFYYVSYIFVVYVFSNHQVLY